MKHALTSVMVVAAMLSASSAMAAKRHKAVVMPVSDQTLDSNAIPLTVNRRSWLDPGNAVSTTQNLGPSYMEANTIFHKTQDRIFNPDKYGNDVIQGQPYVPGRSQPVVQFSSLPNGGTVVDNVLFPQNFYFNPAPSVP